TTKTLPAFHIPLRDVEKGEVIDPHTVRFTFKGNNLRDLPLIVAGMPIVSKAFYADKDFYKPSFVAPMGSGPYEVGDYKSGQFVTYKRRKDYWAADLPVNRGRWNFDTIRYEYFRDRTASFEAFKAGNYDLREEFKAQSWATEYSIPQVETGKIKLLALPDERPAGAQGFFINLRRNKFSDIRVRKALDYVFDFEWMNKNLFYGQYQRTTSIFVNTDLEATGVPSEVELKLLEPFRDQLPPEVFGKAYIPPVTDGSGRNRKLRSEAAKLLEEAGWRVGSDDVRVNAAGERLTIEFLLEQPAFERILSFYAEKLRGIGIEVNIRPLDSAQYQRRLKDFDFDLDTVRLNLNITPGPEMRSVLGSEAAASKGSNNLSGIADPVVDALIDKMLDAKSRDELRVAAKALDRVLRAKHFWVPQFYKAVHTIAFWDRFSWPKIKPKYARGVLDTWWYNPERAAKIEQ
ncbi:MAG TPA: extracellular solute-binding protein, partial [Hyphomicrobiales bacterium]|nr:extracellular solute-binding protein [Hyphomicrobiales bacterium]